MALTDKLTNIANAIRKKTGKTDSLTLDDMVDDINILPSLVQLLNPVDYPDYVVEETARVAKEAIKYINENSIVSLCISDTHYAPDDNVVNNSGKHALMAMKALTHLLPIDFVAHLGDVGNEGVISVSEKPTANVYGKNSEKIYVIKTTENGQLTKETFYRWSDDLNDYYEIDTSQEDMNAHLRKTQLEITGYLKEVVSSITPLFVAVGNHDSSWYITQLDKTDYVSPEFIYKNFTALAKPKGDELGSQDGGGYCYRDFADKKLRVFLLNSMDDFLNGAGIDNGPSLSQRLWFADQLMSLGTQEGWRFIILCHYPADYAKNLAYIIEAYVNGSTITIGSNKYNFAEKNKARFLIQYHGHIHNFLQDNITGNAKITKGFRAAVPQTENYKERYNHYKNFLEPQTYYKTPGTAQDTSFTINIINPNGGDYIHHTICYGAGPGEKTLDLSGDTWTITNILTNITMKVTLPKQPSDITNNSVIQISKNDKFSATLDWEDGYNLEDIVITMGGVDITENKGVWSNKTITIDKVTGNVVITAAAQKLPTTNLGRIAYSFEANSTEIYNGTGYKDGYRLASGFPANPVTLATNCVTTGCIPWDLTTPIVIQGAELIESDANNRMYVVGDSREIDYPAISALANNTAFSTVFSITRQNGQTILTPIKNPGWTTTGNKYFTITLTGTGRDLIIKCGGITEDDGYTITNNLTNISTSNTAQTITENTKYEATLTPNEGYTISNVQVMMGDQTVANAYDSSTNKITIESVTGNIVITASGTPKTYSINNTLTQVTNSNGSTEITHGSSYTATLNPSTGHKISSVSVKMNGIDITSTVYNNGTINIDLVNGNIEITAMAIVADYTVSYSLANVNSTSNITALTYGSSYTTKLTPDNNYIINSVKVTMGSVTVAPTVITAGQEYEINITSVTGDIEITAIASVYNWLPLATEDVTQDSAIYGTDGFKTDTNLSSTSGAERPMSGYCLTGYIPVHYGDTVTLKNIEFYGSDTYDMVAFYCDTYTNASGTHYIGSFQNAISAGKLTPIDGGYTFVVDIGTGDYNTSMTHMRICAKTITNQTVIQIIDK